MTDWYFSLRYRHIRNSERGVRSEFYVLAGVLASKYHMSHHQIEGALTEVPNMLFDRDWSTYSKHGIATNNTLPAITNFCRTEPYLEAMALGKIAEEMMNTDIDCKRWLWNGIFIIILPL